MPLIPVEKKKKEKPFEFSAEEQQLLDKKFLYPEQIMAANHNWAWVKKMRKDEERDADPQRTEETVYKAIRTENPEMLLASIVHLSIAERNQIAQGIYRNLLLSTKDEYYARDENRQLLLSQKTGEPIVNRDKLRAVARRIAVFEEEESIDLFDLCMRLIK
ncbi:MAG: hypothetical protein NC218_01490 [Acetobacter sp.]|nr:hypothetical protein [Acetobacter sp.]